MATESPQAKQRTAEPDDLLSQLYGGGNLHAADVNIALGQLVDLVRAQAKAFAAGR